MVWNFVLVGLIAICGLAVITLLTILVSIFRDMAKITPVEWALLEIAQTGAYNGRVIRPNHIR